MRRPIHFTAALLCVLSLAASRVIECGGWQSSPAARMACCESDSCPMHRDDTGSASVTQAQADSCCAASERHDGDQTPSFAFTPTLVVLAGPVEKIALSRFNGPSDFWRSESPHRPSSTPKHLLDSVLLV